MILTKEQKLGFPGMEDEKWDSYKWSYLKLMEAWNKVHGFHLQKNSYLAKSITNVIYLNDQGKRIQFGDDLPHVPSNINRIIVQFDHIEIEHIKENKDTSEPEKLIATNLQLKIEEADDIKKAQLAILEKTKAAVSLALMAKEAGWQKVIFSGDAYEMEILKNVCTAFGLEFDKSLINDQPLPPCPAFKDEANMEVAIRSAIISSIKTTMNRSAVNFQINAPEYEFEKIEPADLFGEDPDNEIESETQPASYIPTQQSRVSQPPL